jgi:DNA-binding MarR family transcriptional regulator
VIAPASHSGEPSGKTRLRLWLRLLRATRHVEGELRERLRTEFDTTLPRFDVLAALARKDKGLKMSALSRMLMVSNGNVTGIVDRLVTDGMIVRVPIEGDRRATLVRLTSKGREAFALMAARHEAWVDELFDDLTAREAGMVASALDSLRPIDEEIDR